MNSLKEFFLPEGLKVDVTSPDGEQVHISKDDDQGIGHGLAPGLPIGAGPMAPPEPVMGAEPLIDEPPVENPEGEEPTEEPVEELPGLPESAKRLGEMLGFPLAEGDDEIDLSDFETGDEKSSAVSSSATAEPKSSKKSSFTKSGEVDPDVLTQWRREQGARDKSKPKGFSGRWYDPAEVVDQAYSKGTLHDPKGISGEWSWQDLQDERPEIAAAFSETGVDPAGGDFLGDEGRTMWVPKDEDQNAWQWSDKEGWSEMTPEVWQDIADVRDQRAKERDELNSLPDMFGTEQEPSDQELSDIEAGEEPVAKAADGDEDEFDLSDFVPGEKDLPKPDKHPIDDPTSSRAQEPKKSSAKGSGRAPEVGTPEWDEFLKTLE